MKVLVLMFLVFSIALSNAKVYVVSNMKYGHEQGYCGYYVNGVFDNYDKALFVYEDIIARGGQAFVINTNRELDLLNACLHACAEKLLSLEYPERFNKELFIQDYKKTLKPISIRLPLECRVRTLEDLYNMFGAVNEVFVEVQKFLRR